MDGLFFYWLAWIAVVVLLFFVSERWKYRFPMLIHLLMIMIIASYQVNVDALSFNFSVIYIFIAICVYIRRMRLMQIFGFVISIFTVAMAYCCFQLYSMLDPVWLLFDKSWMMAILLNYLCVLLFSAKGIRLGGLIGGMALGDCMTSFLLSRLAMPYAAGSFSWLDDAALALGVAATGILAGYASRMLQTQTNPLQKERQRSYE
ncbi:hypothetical protein CVD28_18020 [Bacillus sp. M6-12]|uniref:YphA family membrane protein n=1 Tax=Bacillus sp. M6-12 TaxID=2054166 RepID=UPI000C765928|nr:hypothetical protein [Bacillus sp. M6-12]PLS16363.1 hypothetical protein CVD28_18020 [Bacillus sp. M6-12]